MVVLISQKTSGGRTRTCNSRCYQAKGSTCVCICSHANHGVGIKVAIENTERMTQELIKQQCQVKIPMKGVVSS